MDYGRVLRRAWQVVWRWKFLWILGFLGGLGGSVSGGSNLSYRLEEADLANWAGNLPVWPNAALWLGLIGCGTLLVALGLMVLTTIAQGGLIAGVQQIEEKGTTTFRSAWQVGARRFWRLLGITLALALPAILLLVILMVVLVLGIVGLTNTGTDSTGGMAMASVVAVVCGSSFCCVLFPLLVVAGLVATFARQAAILEDQPWLHAIERGWHILKRNLGPALLLWLIVLAVSVVASLVLAAVATPVIVALVAVFQLEGGTGWAIALAVCAAILTFSVYAVVTAIAGSYSSAVWTLAYRELASHKPASAEAAMETAQGL